MEEVHHHDPAPCTITEAFDALERVNAAIVGAETSEAMLAAVLDELLEIFDCDRAWLLYPCSLETESWEVPMERNRPAWPGAGELNVPLPVDDYVRCVFRLCLEADGPIRIDPKRDSIPLAEEFMQRFHIRSQFMMPIRPRGDQPWVLGIHHCSEERRYDGVHDLFRAIGNRVADGLTTLLANRELRQSEARLRTMVEHAPEAIVIHDVDNGCLVDANRMAAKLFGLTREQILQSKGLESFSPERQPDGSCSATRAREFTEAAVAGETPIFEWMHQHPNGELLPTEVRLVRLPHPTRNLLRASVIDISERKRAEEERAELEARLAQSQKMEAIGQLTGGVAHDFNNHLTVILGNLELLAEDPGDPEQSSTCIEQAVAAAQRASALTHRLLAFSRRQPLRPEALDVGALLSGMEELLRSTLGEPVEIELHLEAGLWACEADKAQLENAILNLAINARDAMPEGGRLRIDAANTHTDEEQPPPADARTTSFVRFTVTDSGTGMSADILEKIFTPFFTTKDVGQGSGLGLSMVYGFVKQSGGHVRARSEVGVGTTIELFLPRAREDAPPRKTLEGKAGELRGHGERILVVEDSKEVRRLTRTLLEQLGYQVLEAGSGADALGLLGLHPGIDLLVTDVILPGGMNGAKLVQNARSTRPDLRSVYMSGYTEFAILRDGRLDPNVSLIEKPFTRHTLALRVREALGARAERAGP